MQLSLVSVGGSSVLKAVEDNSDFPYRLGLVLSDQKRASPPSPSSFSSNSGARAAGRGKSTAGLCSSVPEEKTLFSDTEAPQRRRVSSAGEVEKPKPPSLGPLPPPQSPAPPPPPPSSSMDLVTGQYLCGQWPREIRQPQLTCMTDKATQTPGFWTDDLEGLNIHKRSASWSSADHRGEIAKLRAQLRRSVLGIHHTKEQESVSSFNQVQAKLPPPSLSSISISKPAVCRVSSYTDSINHELESVFVGDNWGKQQERELQDGRCAPVPPHQSSDHHIHSMDTHLFSNGHHSPHLFPSAADLPQALDPFGSMTDFGEGLDYVNESSSPPPPLASSPTPNNSFIFKRVPPEGCEKIKVFEETFPYRSKGFPVFSCPDRNKVSFVPTGSGPFCPVRQQDSSFFPSDCGPGSQSLQPLSQFKQAGVRERPPPYSCGPYRALHC
ncbi:glucocorticoid-induced transcript 1 protein [Hoplias malabaricus]|uniref:glucocorticoid-induced transcript 1 protein n=1 Tax=Hoplias malabaricus TaxID=27720 RepID=UPI003461C33D